MSTGLNDNELISKVLSGDHQAYAGLVNRYQNYVFTLTLRMVKNREDAEEVAQDVFIKAFKYLDNEKVFEVADSMDSGFRANLVEQKSRQSMVHNAIGLLGPDDAEIITLFYKSEQSLEEIAQILGLEVNTAKVRLHRARTRLKEKMETHFAHEVKDLN